MVRVPINPIKIRKDPDFSRVTKNLTNRNLPCGPELLALMECLNRHSSNLPSADLGCAHARFALHACSQNAPRRNKEEGAQEMQEYIKDVTSKWKMYGHGLFDKLGH